MADPNETSKPRPQDDDRPLTEAEMLGEGDSGAPVLSDRVSESAPWPGDDDAS